MSPMLPVVLVLLHAAHVTSQGCEVTVDAMPYTLTNNGYEGLVVGIDSGIPEDAWLIHDIKRQFTFASAQLYQATKSRAYFKKIFILKPDTWTGVPVDESAGRATFGTANFQIYKTPEVELASDYSVLTTNEDDLKEFFIKTDIIQWHQRCIFGGTPVSLRSVMQSVAAAKGVEYRNGADCYTVQATTNSIKQCSDLHQDYKSGTLTLDDAHQINQEWQFGGTNTALNFIKFAITHLPYVAIRDKQGNLVGYELCTTFGSMGMLYVQPEHRGRGLATYIITALAKQILDSGKPAYSHLVKSNKKTISLHTKCGFNIVEGADIDWVFFMPPS